MDLLLWVVMDNPSVPESRVLSDVFHIHELAIEDALNAIHHPKIESYMTSAAPPRAPRRWICPGSNPTAASRSGLELDRSRRLRGRARRTSERWRR